jgi:hypothetical protein
MITSCEATQDVFSAFGIATHPMNPTRFGRKRTNAGNSTRDRSIVTLLKRLHFVQRLLAGRKRAGKSHETCGIEWLASFIQI